MINESKKEARSNGRRRARWFAGLLLFLSIVLIAAGIGLRTFGLDRVVSALDRLSANGLDENYVYILAGIDLVLMTLGGTMGLAAVVFYVKRQALRSLVSAVMSVDRRTFLLVGLGLSTLLGVVLIVTVPYEPWADFEIYHTMAQDIAQGRGVVIGEGGLKRSGDPSAFWPMGYAAFLAPFYALAGPHVWLAQALNLGLRAGTAFLTYVIARDAVGEGVGRLAFGILAFFPSVLFHSLVTGYNLLLAAILALLVYLMVTTKPFSLGRALLVGLVLGAGIYVRPVLLLFPAVVLVWFWLQSGNVVPVLAQSAVVVVVALLVLLPWTVRNYRVFGEFVPVYTNGGRNLFIGNNPEASGGFDSRPLRTYAPETSLDEVAKDRYYRDLAIEYILEHPGHFLRNVPKKLLHLYMRDDQGVSFATKTTYREVSPFVLGLGMMVSDGYYYGVLLLSGWALVAWVRNGFRGRAKGVGFAGAERGLILPLLVIGFFTGVYVVFFAMDHYHVPYLFALSMVAAYGLHDLALSDA